MSSTFFLDRDRIDILKADWIDHAVRFSELSGPCRTLDKELASPAPAETPGHEIVGSLPGIYQCSNIKRGQREFKRVLTKAGYRNIRCATFPPHPEKVWSPIR